MSNTMVTGSSRGLGLELISRLASQKPKGDGLIFAAARGCSPALRDVIHKNGGRVVFVSLDITDKSNVSASVELVTSTLQNEGLDVLINCAGVYSEIDGRVASMPDLEFQLSVNVLGTNNVIRSFLPLLKKGRSKKITNITSAYASMANAQLSTYALCPAYKISKAALNALTIQYALSHKDEGFIFMAVHPGWLRTEMGGHDADLTPEQSAKAIIDLVDSADADSTGRFRNVHLPGWSAYDGKDIPW